MCDRQRVRGRSHACVKGRNHVPVAVELRDATVTLAVDIAELANDEHVRSVVCDGVDEVVDAWAIRPVELARVHVVGSDVGLVDRVAAGIADLGEVANHDDAVADNDTVKHLAIDYLHRVEARRLRYSGLSVRC